jgi:hypothetical protein
MVNYVDDIHLSKGVPSGVRKHCADLEQVLFVPSGGIRYEWLANDLQPFVAHIRFSPFHKNLDAGTYGFLNPPRLDVVKLSPYIETRSIPATSDWLLGCSTKKESVHQVYQSYEMIRLPIIFPSRRQEGGLENSFIEFQSVFLLELLDRYK